MALDVYFRDDIANAIRANCLSVILTSIAHGSGNVEFVRGALAVAQANCISIGVDWPTIMSDLREQAKLGGWVDLLEGGKL